MNERQKILIVDDKVENLIALEDTLSELDVEIVRATSGDEALSVSLKHNFAVAILDVMMPEMDGYELAQHLRGDKKTYVIPIVFLTASYDDELHMFKGYEAGGVDYIVKPYKPDVLLGKVRVFLELDQHRKHLEALVANQTNKLNERIKEVECLYAISTLVAEPCGTIDESLKSAVDMIPPGWQNSEIARARITFEGREFTSVDFEESKWKQVMDIVLKDEKVGSVEVFYLEEKPQQDEGPFLKEKRNLIIDIARQLGVMIQRDRAAERERHLESVLRSIRNINQLIVKEKRHGKLIQEACDLLVQARGVSGAWIILTDDNFDNMEYSQRGFDEGVFQILLDQFRAGKPPACCQKAKDGGGIVALLNSSTDCEGCVLADSIRPRGALIARLEHNGRNYGYFSIATPARFVDDEEEISLFEEVAGDISFALHSIETEKERKKSEQRYQSLVEHLPQRIFIKDRNSVYISCNANYARDLGIAPEQIVGKDDFAFYPPELSEAYRADDQDVMATGKTKDIEERYQVAHEDRWIHTIKVPFHDERGRIVGVLGIFEDITERKRAEEALWVKDRALESSINAVALAGLDEKLTYVNPAFLKMWGYRDRREVEGRSAIDFWTSPDEAAQVMAALQKTGGGWSGEMKAANKDGGAFYVELAACMILDVNGGPTGLFAAFQDITERKRAEEEKAALEAQIRHNQKMESIGTLASGVAHEINNPITAILNFAELIQMRTKEDERLADYAGRIISETNRVAQIVKNLLAFARQEKESHSPARMADIVNDTLSLIAAVFRKDQIIVEVDMPEDLPKIKCRSQQIQQVLMNLFTNARDALNERYPEFDDDKVLKITCTPFEREGEKWFRTTVENHGKAIPPEVMDRIFDPFFTTKPRDVGTGLGLSISFGIVREHKGELSVESDENSTRFHMDLRVNNGWTLEKQDQAK